MSIQVWQGEYRDVEPMRDLFRQEANCQIIHDSFLPRERAVPYLLEFEGRRAGYGAVSNNKVTEFFVLPSLRPNALPLFRELLAASQATHIEAQTNLPLMLTLLYDCAENITDEAILFHDAFTTNLTCPAGTFRHATPEDTAEIFPHYSEPVGEWVTEANDVIVATGGFLCHYNPPYGDIFMEVAEGSRQQGFGSYLVQEVKRVCYEAGKKPAARCNSENTASRRTLQKAGFLPCGRWLVGEVK